MMVMDQLALSGEVGPQEKNLTHEEIVLMKRMMIESGNMICTRNKMVVEVESEVTANIDWNLDHP